MVRQLSVRLGGFATNREFRARLEKRKRTGSHFGMAVPLDDGTWSLRNRVAFANFIEESDDLEVFDKRFVALKMTADSYDFFSASDAYRYGESIFKASLRNSFQSNELVELTLFLTPSEGKTYLMWAADLPELGFQLAEASRLASALYAAYLNYHMEGRISAIL